MLNLTVVNGFVVAVSNSRSSSAVLHSPTGAFEPVHSSTSRTGSLSESEPSVHVPHHGKFAGLILIFDTILMFLGLIQIGQGVQLTLCC